MLDEARRMSTHRKFTGVIPDVGGPTANMYGYECAKKLAKGVCDDKRCAFPDLCRSMPVNHSRYERLLRKLRALPGIRHVFVASGIRPDLLLADEKCGMRFLDELAAYHVSGQLRLAPEHSDPGILHLMGKGGLEDYLDFRKLFVERSRVAGKKQYLSYYFIAAYPGCEEQHMHALRRVAAEGLGVSAEHVQIFTPTPGTWASVMYHTELHPFTGEALFVERTLAGKRRQKEAVLGGGAAHRPDNARRRRH